MAVYVTSDAHGHVRALDAALSAASPATDDEIYFLGDMVDRGPDPLGVIGLVRSLPGVRVLMGNHERLMLDALACSGAPRNSAFDLSEFDREAFFGWTDWTNNGGATTMAQLETLASEDYADVIGWVASLSLHAATRAGGRTFAFAHAGINPIRMAAWRADHVGADLNDPKVLDEALDDQDPEDLLWIREAFWGYPTGLVDAAGEGPVVVVGHTPSTYLALYAGDPDLVCTTEDGHGMVVALGATPATGGVADRVDIDCAAAAGYGVGRVGVLRLDDGAVWYAEVEEGE